MQISNGVFMLEISAQILGKEDVVHPTLLWDGESAVLLDTGFPRQMHKLQRALENDGIPFSRLNKIIMTHQDIDHIGNLPDILNEAELHIEVLAHSLEKPFIQGEKRLLKITPEAIAQIDHLPKEIPIEWRNSLKMTLENPPKAKVDKTVEDGERLPYCGGITVIGTPGHTPGHISLYHNPSKTLIAGDAMFIVEGELHEADPQTTLDLDLAKASIKKLTQYDIEKVICYHGGLYQGDANQRISELAK